MNGALIDFILSLPLDTRRKLASVPGPGWSLAPMFFMLGDESARVRIATLVDHDGGHNFAWLPCSEASILSEARDATGTRDGGWILQPYSDGTQAVVSWWPDGTMRTVTAEMTDRHWAAVSVFAQVVAIVALGAAER